MSTAHPYRWYVTTVRCSTCYVEGKLFEQFSSAGLESVRMPEHKRTKLVDHGSHRFPGCPWCDQERCPGSGKPVAAMDLSLGSVPYDDPDAVA